jgi:hypothetical protein
MQIESTQSSRTIRAAAESKARSRAINVSLRWPEVLSHIGFTTIGALERVRFELNHDRALSFCFDALSSREPAPLRSKTL